MAIAPGLFFKVFVSSMVFAGIIDMLVLQNLKMIDQRFSMPSFYQRNLQLIDSVSPLRWLFGATTIKFMKSRTRLFPFPELLFASLMIAALNVHGVTLPFVRIGIFLSIGLLLMLISWQSPGSLVLFSIVIPGIWLGLLSSLIPDPRWLLQLRDPFNPMALPLFDPINHWISPTNSILVNNPLQSLLDAVLGLALAGITTGLIYLGGLLFARLLSRGGANAYGFGNVMAAMMVGVFTGWTNFIIAFMINIFLSALISIIFLVWQQIRTQDYYLGQTIPSAPYYFIAGILVLIWNRTIWDILMG
jgi:prepilin signal peptidase PulO-like enzyme (type II secretory pathway)